MRYLRIDGRREVAQQPYVILLTGLHVHHQAGVQVTQSRRLSKRLVQTHLSSGCFAAGVKNTLSYVNWSLSEHCSQCFQHQVFLSEYKHNYSQSLLELLQFCRTGFLTNEILL